jgi:hypothetical protein
MHQHCPLILFELTLHVSNYLVCGFVHLNLSNVHNMNFAHFTNYINNRWNCGVYMVQDFRCVHGTRLPVCTWYKTSGVYMVQDMSKQIYVPPLKDTASPKTAVCWLWRKNPTHNLLSFICTVKVWMIFETRLKSYSCRSYHYLCLHEVSHSQQTTLPDPSKQNNCFIYLYHGGVDTFNQDSTHYTICRNKYTCKHFVGGVCILSEIFSKNRG